jgi:hypothetical protein
LNAQEKTKYIVSLTAWLLGALLAGLTAQAADGTLRQFAQSAPHVNLQMEFWRCLVIVARAEAVLVGVIAAGAALKYRLALKTHEDVIAESGGGQSSSVAGGNNAPLQVFVLGSRFPTLIMGILSVAVTVIGYAIRQGFDLRHLYLIGVALGGILIMAIIAAAAFAILGRQSSTADQGKGTGSTFPFWLMLFQAFGCAVVILIIATPTAWLMR